MKKLLIVLSVLLLCSCEFVNGVNNFFIMDYLKKSYGEDVTFTYSQDGTCELYQVGYCSAYYNASDLDEEVYVVWYDGNGNDMRDDYLFKKYKNQIRKYYDDMFSSVISNKYKVEIATQKSDMLWKKDAKYEDILNYENLNLSLTLDIVSDEADTMNLGETLKDLINTRKVKNVSSLYITTYNRGCNLDDVSKCTKVNSSYIEVKITEDKPKAK